MGSSGYDSFAWFYNRYWGAQWVARILSVLDTHLFAGLPENAAILDLCCGTGHLAAKLTERGFRVYGVDNSAGQLAYARQNAPAAEFIESDAACFVLPEQVHAAYSVFDSLNHIMQLEQLESAFAAVYQALVPGGRFLFDMNIEEGFIKGWKYANVITEDDHVLAVRTSYDAAARVGRFQATMFRLIDGHWQRQDEALLQYAYPPEVLAQALTRAGFEVERMGDAGEFDLPLTGRLMVLARRP